MKCYQREIYFQRNNISMMKSRSLKGLSKDQRTVVLHRLAQASLSNFGLEGGSLTLLQDLVNSSFQVLHDSKLWYLRIYNPDRHDTCAIESELQFMEALADDGFPVPRPLRTDNGTILWAAPPSLSSEPIRISVCPWLRGVPLLNGKTSEHFGRVGTMLARLHTFSANWVAPDRFARPRCDSEGVYGDLGVSGLQVKEAWKHLSHTLRSDLEAARDALQQAEAVIGKSHSRYGLIHADPSFGNILFDGERISLIDFDDCAYGYYLYDLAIILAGAWSKPGFEESCSALLQSYQQVRALSREEMVALPAAMAARAASLIFWAVTQSSQHPWINGQWQRLREYMSLIG